MTWWQIILVIFAIWIAVGALLFVAIRVSIRHEPTAHGQIVGRQIAWAFAIGWPVPIPPIIVASIAAFIVHLWRGRKA